MSVSAPSTPRVQLRNDENNLEADVTHPGVLKLLSGAQRAIVRTPSSRFIAPQQVFKPVARPTTHPRILELRVEEAEIARSVLQGSRVARRFDGDLSPVSCSDSDKDYTSYLVERAPTPEVAVDEDGAEELSAESSDEEDVSRPAPVNLSPRALLIQRTLQSKNPNSPKPADALAPVSGPFTTKINVKIQNLESILEAFPTCHAVRRRWPADGS